MTAAFHAASAMFLVALTLCLVTAMRGGAAARVTGLLGVGLCECLFLVARAEAIGRPIFLDLGLALAVLSYGGALVFARFLERWGGPG